MVLQTAFTDSVAIRHPIALAPMGGTAGGALAAAVSNGGGFGILGAGHGHRDWLDREVAIVRDGTRNPWGIGLLTWAVDAEVVARVVDHHPAAVMLSFGDPTPFAEAVRAAGIRLILQVNTVDEVRRAVDLGADVIVAQGGDAGGHSGGDAIGTMSFVPVAADLAGAIPVLAAGGIADGRGLAAALALGASGVLIGTRFQASMEALIPAEVSKALLAARGQDTELNRVLDIARGSAWPAQFPARTLRNVFLDRWRDREAELGGDDEALREFRAAADRSDLDVVPIWAGQGLDQITAVEPAGHLVAVIAAEAERALDRVERVRGGTRSESPGNARPDPGR